MNIAPLQILLVENIGPRRSEIQIMLTQAISLTYQLHTITNVNDVQKALRSQDYDICLVDHNLNPATNQPDNAFVDGYTLICDVLTEGYPIPIILLISQENLDIGFDAIKTGAADCLIKEELSPALLARAIHYAIERNQTLNTLRESEERYRRLVELSPAAIAIHSAGEMVFINSTGAKLLGATDPSEIIGTRALDFVHPDFLEIVIERIQQSQQDGKVGSLMEQKYLRLDKQTIDVEVTTMPVLYHGKPATQAVFRDITSHKKTEQQLYQHTIELEETTTFLNSIFENIPTMAFVKEANELRFVRFNKAASALTGLTEQEVVGKNDYDFFPKEKADALSSAERLIFDQNKKIDIPMEEIETARGDVRKLHTRKVPIFATDGTPKYLLGLSEDITEYYHTEQALIQARIDLEQEVQQRTAQLRKANEQITALYELGRLITTPLQLSAVLDVITEHTALLLQSDTSAILLVDESTQTLSIKSAFGLNASLIDNTRDRIGESIAGRVVQQGEAIIANDLPNDTRFYNPAAKDQNLLACASVPLIIGDKIIGTLDVHSKTKRYAFNKEHLKILSMIAGQAAVVIEKAQLYEGLQQAHDELEKRVQQRTNALQALNQQLQQDIAARKSLEQNIQKSLERRSRQIQTSTEVAQEIAAAPALHVLFHQVVHLIQDRFGYYHVHVYTLEHNNLIMQEGTGQVGRMLKASGHKIHLDAPKSLVARAARTGQPVLIADVNQAKDWLPNALLPETSSEIAVPITLKERVLGVLDVQNNTINGIDTEDQILLMGLCGQIAIAIDHRRAEDERLRAEQALKAYADELVRSNRDLEEFARIASHDLQEPLRKVIAFGDRLKNRYSQSLDDRGKDYIERMQNAAGRMQTLIIDLLAYSRVTSQAQPFTLIDLKTVVDGVLADLEARIEETQGQVDVATLPTIEAESTQMRQLFQNIISNALKFHKENEPPIIKVWSSPMPHQNQYCQIMVQDNGIGFEDKYQESIFGVFQRLHSRTEYEGTGVGLAVCRKIVERHNGQITAQSTPGEGTLFTISLPLKQA